MGQPETHRHLWRVRHTVTAVAGHVAIGMAIEVVIHIVEYVVPKLPPLPG